MSRIATAAVIVALWCLVWVMLGTAVVPVARHHDFLNLYTGASLAGNPLMHSAEVQLEFERRLWPSVPELVPFARPPFYAWMLAPLSWVPFTTALWCWLTFQASVLAGCLVWAGRRWGADAVVLGALYLPAALGIAHAQDGALVLAIAAAVYVLAERGRDFASGLVLGLGLFKFHLFFLWPAGLVLQRRWRMLAGFCIMAAAEGALSLCLVGPAGFGRYWALLTRGDLERLNPSPALGIDVQAFAANLDIDSLTLRALLVATVVALTVLAGWHAPLWRWFAALSAGSLLVAPHVYGYDATLLLCSLWLVAFASHSQFSRMAAVTFVTPLPFLLALAPKPWPMASSAALLLLLMSLALEAVAERGAHLRSTLLRCFSSETRRLTG